MNSYVTTYYVFFRKITKTKLYENIGCLSEFSEIKNPIFYWAADPFLITIGGRVFVIAELASKITGKGHIGFIELNKKKSKWRPLLKTKSHLSFPNFVKYRDKYIGILETGEDKCVSLYDLNCVDNKLISISRNKKIINDKLLVDTVFNIPNDLLFTYKCDYNNKLFYLSMRRFSQPEKELFLMLDDNKQLRPAGNILITDNAIILPTQNCLNYYGEGLNFNYIKFEDAKFEISTFLTISKDDIKKYLCFKNVLGCHTYNTDGVYEVIDIIRKEHNFLCFLNKLYCIIQYVRNRVWKVNSK